MDVDNFDIDFCGFIFANRADVVAVSGGVFESVVDDEEIVGFEVAEDRGGGHSGLFVANHERVDHLPLLAIFDDVGAGFSDSGLVALGDGSEFDGFEW